MDKEAAVRWELAVLYVEHLVVEDGEQRLPEVVKEAKRSLARVRKLRKKGCECEEGENGLDGLPTVHDHPDKDARIETEAGNLRQVEYAAEQVESHRSDLVARASKAKERALKAGVPLS